MIIATASAIEGLILSALSGFLGESGMQQLWPWNLVPAQSIVLGNIVPRAFHDFPGQGSYACSGKFMPNTSQDSRPKTCFYMKAVSRRAQGNGAIPLGLGPRPRAHMGLRISMPYSIVNYLIFLEILSILDMILLILILKNSFLQK